MNLTGRRSITAAALALGLGASGCMESPVSLSGKSLEPGTEATEVSRNASSFAQPEGDKSSAIITTLLDRGSLLEPGSAYDTVARATLDASARATESELKAAKLRAVAMSKNWLPTISPNISLTSMSDLVVGILLEQVLFDNGRRKGEREFAAADVEVAAVNLAIDMNTRVETAVGLYLDGLKGNEKAALYRRALSRMAEFERIVVGRVEGGISDRGDQRVTAGKINDMRAAAATADETTSTARAELKAITGREFDFHPTPMRLGTPPTGAAYLSVLLAEAEAERAVAQAKVDRAGLLPGVTASASVTDGGTSGGLEVVSEQLGFGTPALLKAIEVARETAAIQVGEAEEDARRDHSRQVERLASFRRQEAEAAQLARNKRETFNLFQAQFREGQRSVMDVISIYEELVLREQAEVDAKYEVILIQLEMARDRGLLADGEEI